MFSSSLRPKKFRACGGPRNHTVPRKEQKEKPVPSQQPMSGALFGDPWVREGAPMQEGGDPTGGGSPPFNRGRAHAALDKGLGTLARWSPTAPPIAPFTGEVGWETHGHKIARTARRIQRHGHPRNNCTSKSRGKAPPIASRRAKMARPTWNAMLGGCPPWLLPLGPLAPKKKNTVY